MNVSVFPTYIVDDDPTVRESIAFMLGASGRPTRTFADGDELLGAAAVLAPGCLLVDMRMPGQDGIDLLRAFRALGFEWPVVIMTGHGEVPVAVQAFQSGAIDFIEKPFQEALLLRCLDTAGCRLDMLLALPDPC
jgi:two-component system response regulator FixJ